LGAQIDPEKFGIVDIFNFSFTVGGGSKNFASIKTMG